MIFKKYLKNKCERTNPELWDKVWKNRISNPPHYPVLNSINEIKDIKTILEIGAGTGSDLIQLSKNHDVAYSDYSPVAVKKFKKNNPKIKSKLTDALNLDFKDSSFDLIYCLGLLEHFDIQDRKKIISEMKRVSKKYILMDVPQRYSLQNIVKIILMIMGKWPYGYEEDFSFYELNKLMKEQNLKIIDWYGRELLPLPRRFKINSKAFIPPKLFSKFMAGSFGIMYEK